MTDAATIDEPTAVPAPAVPMIHRAIVAIMRAIEPIAKDQRNEEKKFNYRGIEQVYNAVHPHFAEHGVFSTSTILDAEHRATKNKNGNDVSLAILRMRFTFWAADGSSVSTEVVGEGMDYNGDKASNKAMSAADKYAILQLLKIPTASMDSERPPHDNPTPNSNAPKATPRGERDNPENRPIAGAELEKLIGVWVRHNEDRNDWPTDRPGQLSLFKAWVTAVVGRAINKTADWTRADLNACYVEIDKMEGGGQ